ncbi:MAG: Rieske (2Fe-2S) protein [Nitrospina sp.]|nr:Rieske (2Fe-2S) protein [Nitrospina sp.]MBT3414351.1 Rieske (2Fe-2S) protein [Nitrospina sp.]MBT3857587.1 Rieske (2Fe-2S) protein [Nitrospina sp.]MBT4104979.1 Rieske (2Fe-2S) protein [Nitrospina sp.]MBT4389146.1 Rieske (2Fe-2S) protein [Nitrospina sp.]
MSEEDLPIGKSAIISAGEDEIALFNYKGKYYAIANKCPHRGSPLGEGRIEEGIVICPNHEWRFQLADGANMQNPELFIPTYPVKVKNDNIYIGLEGESGNIAYGKKASTLPSSLKFSVPTIQKPRNPEEELD